MHTNPSVKIPGPSQTHSLPSKDKSHISTSIKPMEERLKPKTNPVPLVHVFSNLGRNRKCVYGCWSLSALFLPHHTQQLNTQNHIYKTHNTKIHTGICALPQRDTHLDNTREIQMRSAPQKKKKKKKQTNKQWWNNVKQRAMKWWSNVKLLPYLRCFISMEQPETSNGWDEFF